MSAHWHIGMEVECIDPTWGTMSDLQKRLCPNLPTAGSIYRIREIRVHGANTFLTLAEVVNPITYPNQGEPVFMAEKYRPVQKRKADISIFNRILLNPRIRISEDA